MVEAVFKTTVKAILRLDEEEAIWLKGLMQNAMKPCNLEEESEDDRQMRMKFWNALEDSCK